VARTTPQETLRPSLRRRDPTTAVVLAPDVGYGRLSGESLARDRKEGSQLFARLATFEGADIDRAIETTDAVRDRLRSITEELEGWQGVLQLADRQGARLMVLHLFDTEENMRAAEPTFEDMPNRVPEVREMAARRGAVTYLEVPAGVLRGQDI
jgi:hypothetical protein